MYPQKCRGMTSSKICANHSRMQDSKETRGWKITSAVDFCRAGLFGQSWNFIRSVWLLLLPVYLPYIMRGKPDLEIPWIHLVLFKGEWWAIYSLENKVNFQRKVPRLGTITWSEGPFFQLITTRSLLSAPTQRTAAEDEASNIYGTWRIPWGPNSWSKPQERIEQEPEPEVPDNQMLVDMADAVSPSWKALMGTCETCETVQSWCCLMVMGLRRGVTGYWANHPEGHPPHPQPPSPTHPQACPGVWYKDYTRTKGFWWDSLPKPTCQEQQNIALLDARLMLSPVVGVAESVMAMQWSTPRDLSGFMALCGLKYLK